MKKNESTMLPVVAVLGAVLLWGSAFPAMKSVISIMTPMSVMWARMAGAVLMLVVIRMLTGDRFISFAGYRRGDWKHLLGMALCLPCAYFLLEANALVHTSSAQAGVVSASMPLMTACGAWLVLGERMALRGLGGLVLAMASVAWLTLAGTPTETASNPLLGNGLELAAMACAAGYTLWSRHLSARYSPLTLTAAQMVIGFLFFLPGAFQLHIPADGAATTIGVLAYLGTFVSLGAFGLFNYGVGRLPAGSASSFINLVPVVAVFLGWVWLGETLNEVQMVAATGVLLGVWLSQGNAGNDAAESTSMESAAGEPDPIESV